ncbi:hypothetical protein [Deinococcus sp. S9]|uniref:plasmid mobilization protein n=1 Tax=Deinococcus sp. S9 TaxID=2545754 RepID=UPI0010546512|nr:hypothetical protein [Deinococcus sp. S9]TDE87365.1 hypothetical protein E0686_02410 [Deinococcus sp. S9]
MLSYPATVTDAPKKINIPTERERVIGVRMTPAEYEEVRQHAESIGMKAASFMRMVTLRAVRERPGRDG